MSGNTNFGLILCDFFLFDTDIEMYKKYGLFYNTCKDQKQFNSTLCTACFLFEYHTTMAPPQLLAQKYFFYFKIQHFVQKRQLKKKHKPQAPIAYYFAPIKPD